MTEFETAPIVVRKITDPKEKIDVLRSIMYGKDLMEQQIVAAIPKAQAIETNEVKG